MHTENEDFDLFDFEDEVTAPDNLPVAFVKQPLTVFVDGEHHEISPDRANTYAAAEDYLAKQELAKAAQQAREHHNGRKRIVKEKMENLRREFADKMQALADEERALSDEAWDIERAARAAERELAAALQRLRDYLESEMILQKVEENRIKFDEITKDLVWRDKALPHQIDGARILASAGSGILADKMGLGKTLTSLMTADMLGAQRVLIIVPDDVVANFYRESSRWAPHRQTFYLAKLTKSQREMMLGIIKAQGAFVVIINYSIWRKDKGLLDSLINLRFDMVIADEAHSIKNTSTAAYKGVAKIVLADNSCPNCGASIQHVDDDTDERFAVRAANPDRYIPGTYYACIGTQKTPKPQTVPIGEAPTILGCGWSQLKDIAAGIEREYGALRSVKHTIPMTGTPILNKPQDLFPLLQMVDDETFNSEAAFLRTYCELNRWTNKWEFRAGGLESLTKMLAGKYVARDRKSAGVTMPEQEIVYHTLTLDEEKYPAQARVIRQLNTQSKILLSSGKTLPILYTIVLITRKRQANVWPAGIEIKDPETGIVLFSVGEDVQESQKLDFILEVPNGKTTESGGVEGLLWDITGQGDMVNGERAVVFSQFKGPLRELERRCKAAGISVCRFDGDTPDDVRDEIRKDFDRKICDAEGYEPKYQVVLANYRSGGVGLNFDGATQTIILDREWNSGKEEQAFARTQRISQTEETTVHIIEMENTIDTWLSALIAHKKNIVDGFESEAEMVQQYFNDMMSGKTL